jgi:PknH-like extracellular domain
VSIGRSRALASLLVLCCVLVGCGRVVSGDARNAPRPGRTSGPIQPSQLDQLLTPSSSLSILPGKPLAETDMQSSLFIGADPADCHGVVAFGRYPLFPTSYTGREARTQTDGGEANEHQLLEASASYPGDFSASEFLSSVRQKVDACQRPIEVWGDDQKRFTVNPAPLVSDSPDIAHWSTSLAGDQWICEFSVVALANVISEVVTCSTNRSIDNRAIAAGRLKKIEELLNSTA